MGDEVSNNRLYLGNLARDVRESDIKDHFATHGTGKITDIKLMNGFGFIEYEDAMDARDVVPAFHGTNLLGERMTVQFARGGRSREDRFGGGPGRGRDDFQRGARPRRTQFRMQIDGLPVETSWQDLKDFARQSGMDPVYSESGRDRNGEGAFVEFNSADDLRTAIDALDGTDFKGAKARCTDDTQPFAPREERRRSRSPPRRYGGGDQRWGRPSRGYSPPRGGGYRDRSPPPPRRNYDGDRDRYRSPPRARGPPGDDYPPARRAPYDDSYRRDRGPPAPYHNGNGRSYDREPARESRDGRGARDDFQPPREPAYRGSGGSNSGGSYDRGRGNY